MDLSAALTEITGKKVIRLIPLSGGCVADVFQAHLEDGSFVVAKAGDKASGLSIEGDMLRYLGTHTRLPVPDIIHIDNNLLVMSHLPSGGQLTARAEEHAADLIADLHNISSTYFGFETNTLIGGLPQPNPKTDKWVDFYVKHRLLYMGNEAVRINRLPLNTMNRLEKFTETLDKILLEPNAPSLIHGDLWGGNILCSDDKITGLIDPAIHFAHAEVELAFTTLFSTFGKSFFRRYQEHRPLEPGFFEERCDIYLLYPLLVHVRLFGGSYVSQVERILTRSGF